MDHAVSFWVVATGRGELRREALASPATDEVLVQTLYSGVSRGTEALVFAGCVPASEHQRMRAPFQAGDFPAPVKYGYSSVGRVVGGVPALRDALVFCLYPHQDRYCVPAAAVQRLPEGLPPARAVLAANLETALNAVWDAGVRPGDHVAVVGGGSVGLLSAWLVSRIPGCDLQLIDRNPARAAVAATLGLPFATPESARGEADHVLHASGSEAGLRLALQLAGEEASITELSWYGEREVTLPLGAAFHSRRLSIRASQVGVVARAQRARYTPARRLALALSLLRDPALDVLIDSECRFEELPTVMPRLLAESGTAIMHRIRYD
jgi:NADPH:quinone reductase-like Zn-dependent oxidoreductase